MMRPRCAPVFRTRSTPGRLTLRPLAAALILMALTGCDNMSWGGFQWTLQSSARASDGTPEEGIDGEDIDLPPETPAGPVLFLVQRETGSGPGQASLIPLASLAGDSLLPMLNDAGVPGVPADFVENQLSEGRTFTLFSEGTRVGTFRSGGEVSTDSSYCLARPRARGVVEVVPEAAESQTFLALRRDGGEVFRHGVFRPMESTYDQRVASLNLAGDLFPRLSAPWPPSVLDARSDLRIFALDGSGAGAIAVTFMHRDALAVGPAQENAYALFFIAENRAGGYEPGYVWYRPAADGKAAPRFVSHLDWNRDGSDGVLLEVQGARSRWFAAAGRRGGAWQTVFEDPCGKAASTGRAGALD
ncbi:MAG: hypothetical protein WDZ89_01700 [Gemmatimonadota bacterium]